MLVLKAWVVDIGDRSLIDLSTSIPCVFKCCLVYLGNIYVWFGIMSGRCWWSIRSITQHQLHVYCMLLCFIWGTPMLVLEAWVVDVGDRSLIDHSTPTPLCFYLQIGFLVVLRTNLSGHNRTIQFPNWLQQPSQAGGYERFVVKKRSFFTTNRS